MISALHPLWLLLPGIVTLTAAKVISSYLSGIGKPIYSTYIAAGTVILMSCEKGTPNHESNP